MEPQNSNQPNFMDAVSTARPDQLDIETTRKGGVQMNVVNAVNANGVVSGRKVVDFIWQRMAICAMIIATGCLVAVLVLVIIANSYNGNNIKLTTEKEAIEAKLNEVYGSLGVSDHGSAIVKISRDEIIGGDDIKQIQNLLVKEYGENVKIDFTDNSLNFVKKSGKYKVASVQVTRDSGKNRVLMFAKEGSAWAISKYNSDDKENPCKEMSDEEKDALYDIAMCPKEKQ